MKSNTTAKIILTALVFAALPLAAGATIMAIKVLYVIQRYKEVTFVWDSHVPYELTICVAILTMVTITWVAFTADMFKRR